MLAENNDSWVIVPDRFVVVPRESWEIVEDDRFVVVDNILWELSVNQPMLDGALVDNVKVDKPLLSSALKDEKETEAMIKLLANALADDLDT